VAATIPLTLAALVPGVARADLLVHFWEPHHENPRSFTVAPELHLYSAKGNFDVDGAQSTPAGTYGYSRAQTDVNLAYGLGKRLTAYGRLSWAKVTLDHDTFGGDIFGFADQSLGLSFHAWESDSETSPVRLDFQGQLDFPFYDVSSSINSGTPYLGDGSTDVTVGAFLTADFAPGETGRWRLVVGGGYQHRGLDLSAGLPWQVSLGRQPSAEGLILGVSALGLQSLKTDLRGDPASGVAPGTTAASATGGILFVDAINPSYLALRGTAGWAFNPRVSVQASITKMAGGRDVPNSTDFAIGLSARWDRDADRAPKDPARQTPLQYGKSNQGFVDYALEARVTRMNDRIHQIKIDRGVQDGVEVGQTFDVFRVKTGGAIGEAVARARVIGADAREATLSIVEYFKEVWIEEGFVVKRPLQ
jgi:hypothetical protein